MIQVKEVFKTFYKDLPNEKKVLKGVTLSVADGETQFLLGGNGAGKTTLMRIISSLLPMTSGTVTVNGHDSRTDPDAIKHSIGFFSATTGLYERLTGREFLTFFSRLYGLSDGAFTDKLGEMTELFRIEDCLDLKCSAMSSGQKQKINIARALLHDPPIYIMDEPTLGLDVESLAGILDFIIYQRRRRKTMLIVTHNMEMVHKLGGRVAFLVDGAIVNNVTVEEMMQNSGQNNLIDAYRFYAKV
ncbi:MAG: ABC transporter ATP-binding protein [Candidatus Rifleibacteriota bacterium]